MRIADFAQAGRPLVGSLRDRTASTSSVAGRGHRHPTINPIAVSTTQISANKSPTIVYSVRTGRHDTFTIVVPRLNSGVRYVIRPEGSISALNPVFAARTIGTLVSIERSAAIASTWYGAELSPYHASLVMFTRTSAPSLTSRRVRSGKILS